MSISLGSRAWSVSRSSGGLEVAVDRVEEPEGGVGGVVEALLLALGEHVGDQAVADVVGEGAEDVAGLRGAAGGQGQPFEADHRVAAPVGEPVVAGDDGADLLAGGVGAGGVLDAAGGRDQELVGGQHELGVELAASPRRRRPWPPAPRGELVDQPRPPPALGPLAPRRRAAPASSPTTRSRRPASTGSSGGQLDAEEAGAPEVAGRLVAPLRLEPVSRSRSSARRRA